MHRSERPGLALVCSVCGLVRAAIRKRSRNQHYTCPSDCGAAFGLIKWGNDNHYQVFNPPTNPKDIKPAPGDIVVYEFSHTGIVSRNGDAKYNFYAIEGNTNPGGARDGYEVAERGRNYSSVRKFIRLSVDAA